MPHGEIVSVVYDARYRDGDYIFDKEKEYRY